MNSRERVQRAIHFGQPDRIPISHAVLPAARLKYGRRLEELLMQFSDDFGWAFLPPFNPRHLPPFYRKGTFVDLFGTVWQIETEGLSGMPVEFPLSDWRRYSTYSWPEPAALLQETECYAAFLPRQGNAFYARGGPVPFWERLLALRGMENLLLDVVAGRKEFLRLRDDLLEFTLRLLDGLLQKPYDGIVFTDDWGSERAMMIDPLLWRRYFKPVYRQLFEKVKQAGLDVHFHSDGNISSIIPDLLDLGVDVLNCQVSLMDVEWLGKNFAGRVCFQPLPDHKEILPFASPQEVKRHIRHLFRHLGSKKGGLIASGEISPHIPLENIRAMYEAFREFGEAVR